jgi:hypothetical protein
MTDDFTPIINDLARERDEHERHIHKHRGLGPQYNRAAHIRIGEIDRQLEDLYRARRAQEQRDWLREQYRVTVEGDHAHIKSAQGGFSLQVYSHGQSTTEQMVEFAEPIAEFLTALCDIAAAKERA